MINKRIIALAATGFIAVASLAGYASQAGASQQPQSQLNQQAATGPRTQALAAVVKDLSGDYNRIDNPNGLAAASKLVIEGTVLGYSAGRTWHSQGSTSSFQTTIVAVKVSRALKGDASVGETAYIELQWTPETSPAEYAAANPVGAQNLFFLEPAKVTAGPVFIFDTAADIPAGSTLLRPISPQGWAVAIPEEGTVVWPLLGESQQEALKSEEPTA